MEGGSGDAYKDDGPSDEGEVSWIFAEDEPYEKRGDGGFDEEEESDFWGG